MLKSYSKTSVALLGGLMALGLGFSGGVTKAMAAEAGTVLSSAVVADIAGRDYAEYTTTDFILTYGGNNGTAGTSSTRRPNCNLSNNQKYTGDTGVTTTDTAFAIATLTPIAGVGSITYTFATGGNNTNRALVYVLSSSDNLTYSMITPLKTDEGFSAQGVQTLTAGTFTFSFDTIAAETYYAVVVKDNGTSGHFRINGLVVSFIAGAAATEKEPAELAGEFLARLTALEEGTIVPGNATTIATIEADYLKLDTDVKNLVDAGGYVARIAALKQKLAEAIAAENTAKAQEVIDLIAAIGEITDYSKKSQIEAARSAYEALSNDQKALVSNLDVLVAAETAIEGYAPAAGEIDYTTGFSETLTSRAITVTISNYGAASNYTPLRLYNNAVLTFSYKPLLATGITRIETSINSNDRNNYITRFLAGAWSTTPESSTATSPVITTVFATPVTESLTFTNTQASQIRIDKITVYYEKATVDTLVNYMNTVDTCGDYAVAPDIREAYEALSEDDKGIFDNTVCGEDPNCTMGTKLAYMEYLLTLDNQNNSQAAPNLISQFGGKTGLAIILVVGILGMGTVAGFYYLNRKRSMN